MTISKLTAIASLSAVAGLLALGGCKDSKTDDSNGAVTLRFWAMPNTSKPKEDLEAILERFKAENPGIDVQVEILDWGSALTKINTAASSGAGPDVFQVGTTWTASVTDTGAPLALEDLLTEIGGDTLFVPAVRPYMKPIYADSVTSLPWFVDIRPLYYRTDVYQKAGVDMTQMSGSWEAFKAGLKKIRDARIVLDGQPIAPIGIAGRKDWNALHNIYPWIISAGGDIVNATGDSVLLDDPASIKGVLAYLGIIRDGLTPMAYLDKNTAQVSAEFDQGRVATWQESSSKLIYLQRPPEMGGVGNIAAAKAFATALPPAGPAGRKLFIGGSNLAIFKSTRHPAEAKKLLKFLVADKGAVLEYSKASGMVPALKAVFDDPWFAADPNRKIFKDLVAAGQAYPAVPFWGELETQVLNARLGSIFDIAAEVNGPYSEAAVVKELKGAAEQARAIIRRHFDGKPSDKAKLDALKSHTAAP